MRLIRLFSHSDGQVGRNFAPPSTLSKGLFAVLQGSQMKRGFLQIGPGLMIATLLVATTARSEDLLQIYDMAVINDPQIREADATRLANREAKPQAVASLLPAVKRHPRTWAATRVMATRPVPSC